MSIAMEEKAEQVVITITSPNLCESVEEIRLAIDGHLWAGVVEDMDNWFRKKLKYCEPNKDFVDAEDALEQAREALRDIVTDNGLTMC